jgi:hypothetical protein
MGRPDLGDVLTARKPCGMGLVLPEAQVSDGKTGPPQGAQQLVPVVSKSLQPLGMLCAHGQHAATQAERAAVGSELVAGDPRPGLPQGGQAAGPPPLLLDLLQA